MFLKDKHRVAVAKKAVFIFHSLVVGFHDEVEAAKRTDHDEQARLGQVEVCDHWIGDAELVWRIDEFVGPALHLLQ